MLADERQRREALRQLKKLPRDELVNVVTALLAQYLAAELGEDHARVRRIHGDGRERA